eukprot:TRINITY_DN1256_c0_g1_i1.p1 TRINITY_DN1256_c0_g1~~TRINITY_DN1256_c0_g1_i1.p1  ORF type:complete len:269 (+),score=86.49 TRINITY_DN1256_c0_g1_i1:160-966(+)
MTRCTASDNVMKRFLPSRSRAQPRLLGAALLAAVATVAVRSGLSRTWASPPAAGSRRQMLLGGATSLGLAAAWEGLGVEPAEATGGSTAGKFSTIPAAKRRFYGRVKQGFFEFLKMEEPIMAGRLQDPLVTVFFEKTIIKQKAGRITGCQIDLGTNCDIKERKTSRWNDLKVASDLLGSAFRYSASDVNDYLPQVRLIRKTAKKIDKMKEAIDAGNAKEAKELYQLAKNNFSKYAPMVDLPTLDAEDYTHSWDTAPQPQCLQGTQFCN